MRGTRYVVTALIGAVVGGSAVFGIRFLLDQRSEPSVTRDSNAHGAENVRVTPEETLPGRTEVRLFQPFTLEGLANGLRPSKRIVGTCQGSLLSARPDAWRCFEENLIHDPCFESPFSAVEIGLACVEGPWDKSIEMMQPSQPLAYESSPPVKLLDRTPWALVLEDGTRCSILGGATALVAGMRLNFACTDGRYVVGDPDRGESLWMVFVSREGDPQIIRVPVIVAWY